MTSPVIWPVACNLTCDLTCDLHFSPAAKQSGFVAVDTPFSTVQTNRETLLKNTRSPCFRALTFNSNTNRIKPYHVSKCRVDFSQINIGWTKPTLETWAKPRKKEQQIGSSYKRPTAPKWLTNWHLNCKGLQTNMPQNVGSVEDLISKNTQSGHMEFGSLRANSPIWASETSLARTLRLCNVKMGNIGKREDPGDEFERNASEWRRWRIHCRFFASTTSTRRRL